MRFHTAKVRWLVHRRCLSPDGNIELSSKADKVLVPSNHLAVVLPGACCAYQVSPFIRRKDKFLNLGLIEI